MCLIKLRLTGKTLKLVRKCLVIGYHKHWLLVIGKCMLFRYSPISSFALNQLYTDSCASLLIKG